MNSITQKEVNALINNKPEPCVSIYMPTIKAGKEVKQNSIRFKNLLGQAEETLQINGLKSPDIKKLLTPARELVEDYEFWQHQEEGRAAMFHGQGVGSDDRRKKQDILRFFQLADDGLAGNLEHPETPLMLAGVEYLLPLYREANSYSHLLEEGVVHNPEELDEKALHRQAREVIQPYFKKPQEEALAKYATLSNTGKASGDFKEIVKGAYHSRVESLFVSLETRKWGMFDPNSNEVRVHEKFQPGDEDLLNFAAVQTLQHSGGIYILDPDKMPAEAPLAAVMRY